MTAGGHNLNDFAENQLTDHAPENISFQKSRGQNNMFDLPGKFLGVT